MDNRENRPLIKILKSFSPHIPKKKLLSMATVFININNYYCCWLQSIEYNTRCVSSRLWFRLWDKITLRLLKFKKKTCHVHFFSTSSPLYASSLLITHQRYTIVQRFKIKDTHTHIILYSYEYRYNAYYGGFTHDTTIRGIGSRRFDIYYHWQ